MGTCKITEGVVKCRVTKAPYGYCMLTQPEDKGGTVIDDDVLYLQFDYVPTTLEWLGAPVNFGYGEGHSAGLVNTLVENAKPDRWRTWIRNKGYTIVKMENNPAGPGYSCVAIKRCLDIVGNLATRFDSECMASVFQAYCNGKNVAGAKDRVAFNLFRCMELGMLEDPVIDRCIKQMDKNGLKAVKDLLKCRTVNTKAIRAAIAAEQQ